MGCICSRGTCASDDSHESEKGKAGPSKPSAAVAPSSKREEVVVDGIGGRSDGSVRQGLKPAVQKSGPVTAPVQDGEKKAVGRVESDILRAQQQHQRRATEDFDANIGHSPMSRIVSMPHGTEAEQVVAGWPSWLSSVAGEAIKGWVPRRAESFEKLSKIGQGTYSSVYKARDLETHKIVAMKKVRFVNMDPESVRFMAREIYILRKLDHPNVMKLEGLVTSRMSCSLYLVFEYMEHDLAGLAASRDVKFTEPQIKCYMQQLFLGLEHCHSRNVLHRDIKGSNLLINNDGVLKIGDFGLATLFQPGQSQPLTSRVVTLWYRAPELLLGATEYGASIDLWSTGCILAELFAGKPIMPGRTEVEQMHKIFKLCGSPAEEYWRKPKLPHATSFKPQHPYKRRLAETFDEFPPSALSLVDELLAIEPDDRGSAASALTSEFFTTAPLPCDPSSIPTYPPSKEFDAKLRNEARKQRADSVIGRGPESVRRGSRESKEVPTPEFDTQGQGQPKISGFEVDPHRGNGHNGLSHSTSMVHPKTVQSSWTKKVKEDELGHGRASVRNNVEMASQKPSTSQGAGKLSNTSQENGDFVSARDSTMGYVPKKNRIHYSGPLMPPGGNMDDMLKEHERQIQQAVRKARLDKAKTKETFDEFEEFGLLLHPTRNVS